MDVHEMINVHCNVFNKEERYTLHDENINFGVKDILRMHCQSSDAKNINSFNIHDKLQ